MKWFPVSLPTLDKFCLLIIVFLTTILPSVMAIVWLKFYLIAISRNLLKSMESCSTVTATAAATDSTCSVSTVASVPSTSDASSASVSKSRSPRPVISAKPFRTHLEKNYPPLEIPSFDNVTGREWDSRATAYIKQQVKSMFVDKRIKLTNGDLVTWTELEVYECSLEICRILSFKNYLTKFIHTFVKSYWTNAKNVSKGKT